MAQLDTREDQCENKDGQITALTKARDSLELKQAELETEMKRQIELMQGNLDDQKDDSQSKDAKLIALTKANTEMAGELQDQKASLIIKEDECESKEESIQELNTERESLERRQTELEKEIMTLKEELKSQNTDQ